MSAAARATTDDDGRRLTTHGDSATGVDRIHPSTATMRAMTTTTTTATATTIRSTSIADTTKGARRRSVPRATVRARANAASEGADTQELCRAEIPPHLPRPDFVKQMFRWAASEFEEGGLSRYGKRMTVECINGLADGNTNGVLVRLYDFRDGTEVEIAQLIAKMDDEKVQVWDTIVPTKDGGIEKMNRDGKDKFIDGRFFVVSRPLPADETANSALKAMIKRLMLAINAYYSFGSPFAEEF